MEKTLMILLGVCLVLALILIGYNAHKTINTEPKKFVNERFVTIKIDGQEYLWGQFNNGNILVPKTPKCSCDTIK